MNLKKEQIIKSKLGLLLKLLLITLAIFKIAEFIIGNKKESRLNSKRRNEQKVTLDSTKIKEGDDDGVPYVDSLSGKEKAKDNPIPNTASVYIFDDNGLDVRISRLVGDLFFKEYALKGIPKGFSKEELLLGNLETSANTELICVGKISYSYFSNSRGGTSCAVSLYFDAYNKTTGERMKSYSKSMDRTGVAVGDNKEGAKHNALKRIGF
ncbi:hypothetical protein [Maribacter sp. R77961]|uniref:hypothetical protein n=1 Tax=Maribacter sp. R77961 TaxID=3093871 RepID=UPI0037C7AB6F